jgi:DNA-binding transcriptional ArsR family regulator
MIEELPMKKAKADPAGRACGEGPCCPTRPKLGNRPLLSPMQAGQVMGLFKALANDTRLRLLHQLIRVGESGVTALAETMGMSPQAVSNQLQRLTDWGMLASRREGNNIYYRVVRSCIPALLDLGLCLLEDEACPADAGSKHGA